MIVARSFEHQKNNKPSQQNYRKADQLKIAIFSLFKQLLKDVEQTNIKSGVSAQSVLSENNLWPNDLSKNVQLFGISIYTLLTKPTSPELANLLAEVMTVLFTKTGERKQNLKIEDLLPLIHQFDEILSNNESNRDLAVLRQMTQKVIDFVLYSLQDKIANEQTKIQQKKDKDRLQIKDVIIELQNKKEYLIKQKRLSDSGKLFLINQLDEDIKELEKIEGNIENQYDLIKKNQWLAIDSREKDNLMEFDLDTRLQRMNLLTDIADNSIMNWAMPITQHQIKTQLFNLANQLKYHFNKQDVDLNFIMDIVRKPLISQSDLAIIKTNLAIIKSNDSFVEQKVYAEWMDDLSSMIDVIVLFNKTQQQVENEEQVDERYQKISQKIDEQIVLLKNKKISYLTQREADKYSQMAAKEIDILEQHKVDIQRYYESQKGEFDYEAGTKFFDDKAQDIDLMIEISVANKLDKMKNLAKDIFQYAHNLGGSGKALKKAWKSLTYSGDDMKITECERNGYEKPIRVCQDQLANVMKAQGISNYNDIKLPAVIGILCANLIYYVFDDNGNIKMLDSSNSKALLNNLNNIINDFVSKNPDNSHVDICRKWQAKLLEMGEAIQDTEAANAMVNSKVGTFSAPPQSSLQSNVSPAIVNRRFAVVDAQKPAHTSPELVLEVK